MKFIYNNVNVKSIDINFQEIFEEVSKEIESDSVFKVYDEFCDNVGYYLKSVYKIFDFEEEYNELEIEELMINFESWLDEKFGENWDEELCD